MQQDNVLQYYRTLSAVQSTILSDGTTDVPIMLNLTLLFTLCRAASWHMS
jgi:hypothetical protein